MKPQIRKERLSMLPQLNNLGEFDLGLPAGDFIYKVQQDRGMDINVHFPEPVPTTAAPVGILAGNPHPNAARLFVNWLLSKEGQIAMHVYDAEIPSHTGLPAERFQPYPKELAGKKLLFGAVLHAEDLDRVTWRRPMNREEDEVLHPGGFRRTDEVDIPLPVDGLGVAGTPAEGCHGRDHRTDALRCPRN